MKETLTIILLLASCFLWPSHVAFSAQKAEAMAVKEDAPAATDVEEYASVAKFASAANIRSEASLSADVLRAVPPGYPLAVLERKGDWVLVEDFMERKGWVSASLLSEPETAIIKVWKGNLRTGPGLTEGIIAKLDHGTLLTVIAAREEWLQVNGPEGLNGWVHRDVLWPAHIAYSAESVKEITSGTVKKKVDEAAMSATAEKKDSTVTNVESDAAEDRSANTPDIRSKSSMPPKVPRAILYPRSANKFRGNISVEGRFFPSEPLYPDQKRNNGSIALAPEFYHEWASGSSIIFVPFFRLDSADSERTHFDIRELNFLLVGSPWELRLGISKVFWGVTEFVHLVDIINQTDLVEDIRAEDKLGQPMVQLSIPTDWGVFDFFVLPYFRERTFPGPDGRLRTSIVVDTDSPLYESSAEENHVDFALRYSKIFASGDLGLYYFKGTGRDPLFIPSIKPDGQPVLLPYYQLIDQAGMDLQLVTGNWLWKLEALYQDNDINSYFAATGGFEYTFFGIGESMMDLGVIAEYAYDDRDDEANTPFDNDLFGGLRLAVNDAAGTGLLLGLSYDLDGKGNVLQFEASRRLGESFTISLEGWAFFNTEPEDYFLYDIRDDDFLRLQIFYYF